MRNFKYNSHGTIDCDINHEIYGVIQTTLSFNDSKNIELSGVEIEEYYTPERSRDDHVRKIKLEILSLEPTIRMISGAIIGDEWAIKKIKDLEKEKSKLRDRLKTYS